jgi:His/Glu/Gln/Arg/opine family amino acid ABC transporter permease subunit
MDFIYIIREFWPMFVRGAGMTVYLTVVSALLAFILGSIIAVMRIGPIRPLRAAASFYIEVMRAIPLLALMILVLVGLPKVGIFYSTLNSAILTLSIYTAAYVAEALRSGFRTVPKGQIEAARALGMTFGKMFNNVLLPQSIRTVMPPLGNLLVSNIKATALAGTIGVQEIYWVSARVNFDTAMSIAVFIVAALCYLAVALPTGFFWNKLEVRMKIVR